MDGEDVQYQVAINYKRQPLKDMFVIRDLKTVIIISYYFDLQQQFKLLNLKKMHRLTLDNMKHYYLKDMAWCIEYLKESNTEIYQLFTQQ